MLSRAPLQTHHDYNQSYLQSAAPFPSQTQLSSPTDHGDHYTHRSLESSDNLQAGRKRRESEMDSMNDSGESNNVRRRISRACDQCNQLRTRCDGRNPCAHCTEIGLQCDYVRAHKKRGRAPKKDQDVQSDEPSLATGQGGMGVQRPQALAARKYSSTSYTGNESMQNSTIPSAATANGTYDAVRQNTYYGNYNGGPNMAMNGVSSMHDSMVPAMPQQHFPVSNPTSFAPVSLDGMQQGFGFPLGDDYSVAFMRKAPVVESPDWMALTTPLFIQEPPPLVAAQARPPDKMRFPVLRPLLPHLEPIMPQSLASDLLEQYFASSTSAYLRPSNPYVLGHIFRKKSILHPTDPRPCTPALLASMLWIAAQTSDLPFLTSQLDARGKVCQKLLELTISMLKPLIHNSSGMVIGTAGYTSVAQSDARLGGLVVPTDHTGNNNLDQVQIDNLATYIHLATVVSASERKAASLRWWNAAWSLARELRLGRELPEEALNDEAQSTAAVEDYQSHSNDAQKSSYDLSNPSGTRQKPIGEEGREERRRTWWLLYMQDRHLALCYNRPMFFLNKECEGLLQPLDDDVWQSGRFEMAAAKYRQRGLDIKCTSHSVFGYFLPLMVILGEILDLNHARNRPRFGPKASQPRIWDEQVDEITMQLETYAQSLQEFDGHLNDHNLGEGVTPSVASSGTTDTADTIEIGLQTKTVIAYGTHIMHVLHVLLTGKWFVLLGDVH